MDHSTSSLSVAAAGGNGSQTRGSSRAPSVPRREETGDSEKAGRVWARGVGDPWDPCILTCDGGGIRGYSSLLILKALMVSGHLPTSAQAHPHVKRTTGHLRAMLTISAARDLGMGTVLRWTLDSKDTDRQSNRNAHRQPDILSRNERHRTSAVGSRTGATWLAQSVKQRLL